MAQCKDGILRFWSKEFGFPYEKRRLNAQRELHSRFMKLL